ncbi:hypothetical protein [uncultured Brevundimonas sp.]|uniref:hypothetical protein n=1 Tax=uncultured Brevundimonas sp. TaxID=213418 RepID=UPI0025DEFD12|nr:hypothetical protein [uncultured Brevundimonas sp.]
MMDDNADPCPDEMVGSSKPSLFEPMTDLGVEEFYITVDLTDGADDGSVRVLSISPKPQK